MTASKTPTSDELAELDERVRVASERARALAEEAAAHGQEVARLKAERIAAFADDDEPRATALGATVIDAQAQGGELADRRQGAEVAARRAQQARDEFITANCGRLVREREPAARAITRRIERAVAALSAAATDWHAEARTQAGLLRSAGQSTKGVPDLPIRELIRDLERATSDGVVLPVAGGAAHVTAPEAEPEPAGDIRDGARAALRASRAAKSDPDDAARPMIEQIG